MRRCCHKVHGAGLRPNIGLDISSDIDSVKLYTHKEDLLLRTVFVMGGDAGHWRYTHELEPRASQPGLPCYGHIQKSVKASFRSSAILFSLCLQRVVDKLDASQGMSARENAALVLGSIARSTVSPLTYSLGAPPKILNGA